MTETPSVPFKIAIPMHSLTKLDGICPEKEEKDFY
jgi:hypothetical protein